MKPAANKTASASENVSEWAVLGCMVRGGDYTCAEVSEIIDAFDFTDQSLGAVYRAILRLSDGGQRIERTTLQAIVADDLPMVDSGALVLKIFDSAVSGVNAIWYAERIRDAALMLRTRAILEAKAHEGREWTGTALEFVEEAQRTVLAIEAKAAGSHGAKTDVASLVPEWRSGLWERYENGESMTGLVTGLPSLNRYLRGGFQPGRLYILAARPGVGKTSLALQMVVAAARFRDAAVRVFSLEMDKDELLERLIFTLAEVDTMDYADHRLTPQQRQAINNASEIILPLRIDLEDDGGMTLPKMANICRRAKFAGRLDMIIVDYAQLLKTGKVGKGSPENRVQEVSEITRALKQLAAELKVPVIALSQLSRAVEHRADATPKLSDLRESGSFEQDANVVMFLYELEESGETGAFERQGPGGIIEKSYTLDIQKNRQGKRGKVPLLFWPGMTKFVELALEDKF